MYTQAHEVVQACKHSMHRHMHSDIWKQNTQAHVVMHADIKWSMYTQPCKDMQ